jgi:hypothetical protein
MFVRASELPFDLKALIEQTIENWSAIQAAGVVLEPTESYGDFIAAELNASGLRSVSDSHDDALFNATASEAEFRSGVIAGLDRWLVTTEYRPRTHAEWGDYCRPLGE